MRFPILLNSDFRASWYLILVMIGTKVMQYLFGDSGVAAKRLKLVAEVFAETTKAFLLDSGAKSPGLCVDLGCGPGYSTHLLGEVVHCDSVIGLDNSRFFISLARKTETEKVSFFLHDVTSVPFPEAPADLIYYRFLLTHLKDPEKAISKWATQLRLGGLLLLEEVEHIHTRNDAFNIYLRIVEAMLEDKSNKLYVGPILDTLRDLGILRKRVSRVKHVRVAGDHAASMFYLNMQSWKNQSFVRKNFSSKMINQLEGNLSALTNESRSESEIEWELRQIVFERA